MSVEPLDLWSQVQHASIDWPDEMHVTDFNKISSLVPLSLCNVFYFITVSKSFCTNGPYIEKFLKKSLFRTIVREGNIVFTTRKRSFRRLCFHRCLSFQTGEACLACRRRGGLCDMGGRAWQRGCKWRGACVAGGGHACQGTCPARGVSGGGREGACMPRLPPPSPRQILRDTVNERTVRILLECSNVVKENYASHP